MGTNTWYPLKVKSNLEKPYVVGPMDYSNNHYNLIK